MNDVRNFIFSPAIGVLFFILPSYKRVRQNTHRMSTVPYINSFPLSNVSDHVFGAKTVAYSADFLVTAFLQRLDAGFNDWVDLLDGVTVRATRAVFHPYDTSATVSFVEILA